MSTPDRETLREAAETFWLAHDFASLGKLLEKYPETGRLQIGGGSSVYSKCWKGGLSSLIACAMAGGEDFKGEILEGSGLGAIDLLLDCHADKGDPLYVRLCVEISILLGKGALPLRLDDASKVFQRALDEDLRQGRNPISERGLFSVLTERCRPTPLCAIATFRWLVDKNYSAADDRQAAEMLDRLGMLPEHEALVEDEHAVSLVALTIHRKNVSLASALLSKGFVVRDGEANPSQMAKDAGWSLEQTAALESIMLQGIVERAQSSEPDDADETTQIGIRRRNIYA